MAITKNALIKYKLVIDEWFINGFNGTQAYFKYYPNVKKETATQNFNRIYNYKKVQEYVEEKREEARKFVDVTHKGILEELKNWIESDITETIGLSPEEIKKLPIELKRIINKYKIIKKNYYDQKGNLTSTDEFIELSFISKERAIEMINKHIGFYEKDNRQKKTDINLDNVSDDILMKLWDARTNE